MSWQKDALQRRNAELRATLARAAKYGRTLLCEHLLESFTISQGDLRDLARKWGLSHAIDDGLVLTRRNYPTLDDAPGPIDRTHGSGVTP